MAGVADWLDRRTGIRGLLHQALDEPIPGGARLAYVFGLPGLLFLFLSFTAGVFLALSTRCPRPTMRTRPSPTS